MYLKEMKMMSKAAREKKKERRKQARKANSSYNQDTRTYKKVCGVCGKKLRSRAYCRKHARERRERLRRK